MAAISTAVSLYRTFLLDVSSGSQLSRDNVERWRDLEKHTASTSLSPVARDAVGRVAHNVQLQAAMIVQLRESFNEDIGNLSVRLRGLQLLGESERQDPRKRGSASVHMDAVTRMHRSKRSRVDVQIDEDRESGDRLDPVRQYFIDHISSPYPSPSEKDRLCKKANISRRKLESDLTNWRRRSEWTEIMNTYCRGDKGLMQKMIEDVEAGVDVGEEIRERYDRMRAYLEKRDEQAGEWVAEIEEMIRTGEIDRPNLPTGQDVFPSRPHDRATARLDLLSDDDDEDAEGESDNEEVEMERSPSLVEVDASLQPPAPVASALFTTSPMPSFTSSASSTTPSPIQADGRPIWLTSPQPAKRRVPSTRSSYSSLSAASHLARSTGPHSRSTSGSTRSVSSSSATSAAIPIDPRLEMLKRPAQQESFTRSIRSKADDLLTTDDSAPWVAGHAPGEGFHIGSDPNILASYPVPHFDMPGDITPYLMAPDAWSTETPFVFMPHVTHPTAGMFEMPPSYDFTFEQVPMQVQVQAQESTVAVAE